MSTVEVVLAVALDPLDFGFPSRSVCVITSDNVSLLFDLAAKELRNSGVWRREREQLTINFKS